MYQWDFGDGTSGIGVAPTHTYLSVGTFTVSLMVKDMAGNSAASSATVAVEVIIPEFDPWIMLGSLIMLTLAAAGLLRKRKQA